MLEGIMAGFECATQRRRDGGRHDFIRATRHDAFAELDYGLLRSAGVKAARDGLRWHLIERQSGRFDWSSFEAQHRAARLAGVTVAWDLMHYGWPDHLSPLDPEFGERFAGFAAAAARRIGPGGYYTPVNEISFMAWGGGEVGYLEPFRTDCAPHLKRAFCRAAIQAARAIRIADPQSTILTSEPLLHVVPAADHAEGDAVAAALLDGQHEATLALLGRRWPELGGAPALFDMVGLNYYPHNQFDSLRSLLALDDPRRRPLRDLLGEARRRYGKPLLISETGAQGSERAPWLAHICEEVRAANRAGAEVGAVCLYPILNHLGWDDDRYCEHGLFCGVDERRSVHQPLADTIAFERRLPLAAMTVAA